VFSGDAFDPNAFEKHQITEQCDREELSKIAD
jgi:hypothetical protein